MPMLTKDLKTIFELLLKQKNDVPSIYVFYENIFIVCIRSEAGVLS